MATRALIRVEGFTTAALYKHYDGYLVGTLGWLESFNQDFIEHRGVDPSCCFAQLIRSSIRDGVEHNLDLSKYTGWRVVAYEEEVGQEYEYMLHSDGSVTYSKISSSN